MARQIASQYTRVMGRPPVGKYDIPIPDSVGRSLFTITIVTKLRDGTSSWVILQSLHRQRAEIVANSQDGPRGRLREETAAGYSGISRN